MREETGTIDGDVQLTSDLHLTGTIEGTAVVGTGRISHTVWND